MRVTVVLTCAGRSGRWSRHAGVLKQLAPINRAGESILARTVRLLRSNGVNDIYIATDKPEIRDASLNAEIIAPASNRWFTQTVLSTRHVWGDRTIVVHGDVYLSYGGKDGSWPTGPNPLFTEVNDTTQDCDIPADYRRLLFVLKLCGHKDVLDWADEKQSNG